MFIEERHQKILNLLKENGSVKVEELSSMFSKSEDSIRRDLRILEKEGLLRKTHGGAIAAGKVSFTENYSIRKAEQKQSKEKIAKLASSYISSNDTILIDGSTTTSYMVPYLKDIKALTVITNSIQIANEIINLEYSDINLHITGGMVKKDTSNTVCIETLEKIRTLHVDKVFLSPCSISEKLVMYATSTEEAYIKKAMLDIANKVYILTDSTKIGYESLSQITGISPGYTLITDEVPAGETENSLDRLEASGLKVIKTNK